MARLAVRFATPIPELRRMRLWEIGVLVDLDAELTRAEQARADQAQAAAELQEGRHGR